MLFLRYAVYQSVLSSTGVVAERIPGLDVQLKILQALPSLLQNYSNRFTGELLASAFEVCFLLLGSKTTVISSTAAATLQQLVVSVLGKVGLEDGTQ